jgi:hypothetical protein
LIALLAASPQPGSTLLAMLVAACLLYLGMAAIAVPGNPGSWGLAGGAIAILRGMAYLAITTRASTIAPARSCPRARQASGGARTGQQPSPPVHTTIALTYFTTAVR